MGAGIGTGAVMLVTLTTPLQASVAPIAVVIAIANPVELDFVSD